MEGSLHTRKWTDKEGVERHSTEVRGDSMQMLDSKGSDQDQYESTKLITPKERVAPKEQTTTSSVGEKLSDIKEIFHF